MLKRLHRLFFFNLFISITWLFLPVISFSQDHDSHKKKSFLQNMSIGSKFYYGSFLTTKSKAEYIRDSYTYYGEIFIQHQTDGSKDWQVHHHYPQWGVGFVYGNTGSRQYIGNMNALYAYLTTPLIISRNYTGSLLLGAGPAWVNKPFSIHTNPKNTLIGTRLNAFLHIALQNEIKVTGRFFLTGGLNFVHLSNGGTTLPNLGLNTPGFLAGLRYAFDNPAKVEKHIQDSFTKKMEFKIYTTIGLKQAPWIGGNHYAINTLQLEVANRFSPDHSYGGGVILFNNRSLNFFPLENPSFEKRNKKTLQAGIYGSYEHFFGKLSIPVQLGVYAYNKDKSTVLFQQFGLRYQFSKHMSTALLLKSHLGQADFIHTGLGYNF